MSVARSYDEKTVVESGQDARQGRWGRPVLMVLVVALLLAAVAWAIAEYYGQAIQTDATTAQISAATVVPLLG
ncbi:MAG: hypothetical protein AB7I52_11965 [Rhizobiaceae bacterium]